MINLCVFVPCTHNALKPERLEGADMYNVNASVSSSALLRLFQFGSAPSLCVYLVARYLLLEASAEWLVELALAL